MFGLIGRSAHKTQYGDLMLQCTSPDLCNVETAGLADEIVAADIILCVRESYSKVNASLITVEYRLIIAV